MNLCGNFIKNMKYFRKKVIKSEATSKCHEKYIEWLILQCKTHLITN